MGTKISPFQYSYDLIPLFLAALISFIVAVVVLRKRSTSWGLTYALLMATVGSWCLGYAMELMSTGLAAKIFWTDVQYIGVVAVPLLWMVFVCQYTNRDHWLSSNILLLMSILPVVTLILAWSNNISGLVLNNLQLAIRGEYVVLTLKHGIFFWIYVVYSYSLLLASIFILLQTMLRSYQLYRDQIWFLLIAALAPWVGNALYNFGFSPNLDLTPLGFTLTGLVVVWNILRYQFLDLVPMARETVVERMSDGMIVLDLQKRVVDLNPAAQRITGRAQKLAIGETISDLFPEYPDIDNQIEATSEFHKEINFAGQQNAYYDLHVSELCGRNGEVSGHLIVVGDITQRKRAEKEREEMLNEIRAANEQLKKIDRTKDEFLSIVTHDLKTPLTVILGYAGVLLSGMGGVITDHQRGMIETMKRQAISQQEMIDTILDYTRMEFGRIVVNPEKIPLNEMVKEMVEAIQLEADKKKIKIKLNAPAEEITLYADKRMMGRIINNLIGNAIKYTPEGGDIQVSFVRENDIVRFTFADTGIGIEKEHLGKIFEKFFIVDAAGARERRSLGLGLSIVKSFIEAHAGKIWAESEGLGQGSRFIVEMPLEYVEKKD